MTRFTLSLMIAIFGGTLLFSAACAKEQTNASAQETTTTSNVTSQTLPPSLNTDWRELDLENTLYITTKYGVFVVEMAPEFAPNHVAQIKILARQKFYDDITFHRVIDGFMNQTGDPKGDGTGDSQLPDIDAEFTFRRPTKMTMTTVARQMFDGGVEATGFYKSYPIASKPISQAILTKDGKVEAWGVHCPGTLSMARGPESINSANSQFFLMRGESTSLNQLYSIWGMTVWGREHLTKINVGTFGKDPGFIPDMMLTVRVAADVPTAEIIPVQVMKTDSQAFKSYVDSLKSPTGKPAKVCDITVPSRLKP